MFKILSLAIASKFLDLLLKFPNSAMPVIDDANKILEYPKPFPNAVTGTLFENAQGTKY